MNLYKEQEFQPGRWSTKNVNENQRRYDVDVTSVDIFSLARHGRFPELEYLLQMGVDPNSKDKHGNTILIIGAQNGNKSIVKLALRHGALLNMSNCMGNSALHFAVVFNYTKVKDYLLQKGANTTITNLRGYKAIEGTGRKMNIGNRKDPGF